MSDGRTLWAYVDGSLYFIARQPPNAAELVGLEEVGYAISLAKVKARGQRAVLVATQPLTDETRWEHLHSGELLVAREGRV